MAKIITIASGKGGTGKSSCAVCLARELAASGRTVLLTDCDIGLGSLDIMLGTGENIIYNWGDIICGACTESDALINAENGIALLPAPKKWDDRFTPYSFCEMLAAFENMYDIIIIDSPAGTGRGFSLALRCAGCAVLVTPAETISVRSCRAAADIIYDAGITELYLLINKFIPDDVRRGKLMNIDEVIDAVAAKLIGVIPFSEHFTSLSMNSSPLPPRSDAALAVKRTAKRLEGEDLPLKKLEKLKKT